jgi:hypothetical protein
VGVVMAITAVEAALMATLHLLRFFPRESRTSNG